MRLLLRELWRLKLSVKEEDNMSFDKMTDEELIQLLREGRTEITDYLMEKYKELVRQKAKAVFLIGGENDDLIQEGMIGLFKAIRDFDPKAGASFGSFADLCVTRQLYSAIKAAGRKKHQPLNTYISIYGSDEKPGEGYQLPLTETIEAGAESNPEEKLLHAEYAKALEDELQERLSKFENRVLYLHLLGMDYIKIAEITDKSPKAIDNALQRIKTKTRQMMQEKTQGDIDI